MRIENFISLRFLKESRRNKDISTASMIVITVIAVGIIFFISAVSIMNGYIYGIIRIALEVKSFHLDFPAYYSFKDTEYLLEQIRKDKEVLYSDLYREAKVLLSANGKNTGQIYFRSFSENIFQKDTGLDQCIKLLSGEKNLGYNLIMISQKTAEKLRLKVGDYLYLTAMLSDKGSQLTLYRLKISGIFTTGYVELDEQLSYIGNKTADKIFNDQVGYNIFIKLKDYRKTNQFLLRYEGWGMGGMFTWEDKNYNELTALHFEKNVIAFIVILVVFVAVFNILTSIYITVNEKKQDIGILKAIGYSPRQINLIFLLNGIYLGFIGVIVGVIIGVLIMNWLNEILHLFAAVVNWFQMSSYQILQLFTDITRPERFEIFSKDFYLDKIYTEISFFEILLIAVLTLFFSILAAIIPAFKAGNIKPIEVIKNG